MRVWRICRERHASNAFSGEGSRLTAGRWNSEGVPVAYASEHLSLAAIELFVHVPKRDEPLDLMAVEAEFPIAAETALKQQQDITSRLNAGWRFDMAATRALGEKWFRARTSAVTMVPSVVIDVEWNILLNPEHADFAKLKVLQVRPFRFDERMFTTKS
jgi:RES domain-containing protein